MERILNDFEHDQRFFSERELVRLLKFSPDTIRHALRNLVAQGYLKPAVRQGFFVQKLVPARYVGIICPAGSDSSPTTFVENFSLACRNNNFLLNFYPLHKEDDVDTIVDSIRHRPIEERIISTGLPKEFSLRINAKLKASGYKHLVIGPQYRGFSGNSLSFDHNADVDKVLDHLVELGHERIVFIVNEPSVLGITDERAGAVKRKIRERKLKHSSLVSCDTKFWEDSFDAAYRKMDQIWTASAQRPTAIIPLSANGTLAVLRYAFVHGINIPEELSTLSFDPLAIADRLPLPLTELTFSSMARAEKALTMLWSDSPTPLHDSVDTQLIVRDSTGPAPRH